MFAKKKGKKKPGAKRASAHDAHPSVAVLAQRGVVTKTKLEAEDAKTEGGEHEVKPSMAALDEAEMVDKGIKYWTEQQEFEHPSVEWWQLKSAKDFKKGMGETLHRGGTLSRWTDGEVKALLKDMEQTLAMAKPGTIVMNSSTTGAAALGDSALVSPEDIDPSLRTVDADDSTTKKKKKKKKKKLKWAAGDGFDKADLGEAEAEWDAASSPRTEGKRTEPGADDGSDSDDGDHVRLVTLLDLQQYVADQKGLEDSDTEATDEDGYSFSKAKHQRTATAALRGQLMDMTRRLQEMEVELDDERVARLDTEDELFDAVGAQAESDMRLEKMERLRMELAGTRGALLAAEDQLQMSDDLVAEQEQEILNLQRQLAISKEVTDSITSKMETVGTEGRGLTHDDLMDQRLKDAQRFAIMISAMQEQLDWERKQFTGRISLLEKELENKDGQIGVLYELYNQLVAAHKKEATKSWFTRVKETVYG